MTLGSPSLFSHSIDGDNQHTWDDTEANTETTPREDLAPVSHPINAAAVAVTVITGVKMSLTKLNTFAIAGIGIRL